MEGTTATPAETTAAETITAADKTTTAEGTTAPKTTAAEAITAADKTTAMKGTTTAPETTAAYKTTAVEGTTAADAIITVVAETTAVKVITTAAETTAATTTWVTTTVIIPAEVRSEVTVSVKLTSESFQPALKDRTTSAYKELRAEVIKTVSALHFGSNVGGQGSIKFVTLVVNLLTSTVNYMTFFELQYFLVLTVFTEGHQPDLKVYSVERLHWQ